MGIPFQFGRRFFTCGIEEGVTHLIAQLGHLCFHDYFSSNTSTSGIGGASDLIVSGGDEPVSLRVRVACNHGP